MSDFEIRKTLVISTGNVSQATCNAYRGVHWVASFLYGNYYWVDSEGDIDIGVPDDLKACLNLAYELGCQELKLDSDADLAPGLTVYEW